MAKIVYVCVRGNYTGPGLERNFNTMSAHLTPDNITPKPPTIVSEEGVSFGIFNPNDCVLVRETSVCLGNLMASDTRWWEPLMERPDGSYAVFRASEQYVEVLTDAVGSRTVWYFKNDNLFIASTSQRAIIMLLGNFVLNETVIPWVLSTGTLGPAYSWDSRIKCLEGSSSLRLDRAHWALTTKQVSCGFAPLRASDGVHEKLLREALADTFAALELDYSKWVLPLSGGFDSRCILASLKDTKGLRAVTWGLRSSLSDKRNDAYVARALARFFGLQHRYYETNVSSEPIHAVFGRFLVCGEGRIDHISGYMDGFKIWKTLFEDGVHGILRGDEGFGWVPVSSPLDVRNRIGLLLWSDFVNLKPLEEFGLSGQALPGSLLQREGESLETWRDRLYHEFRIPVFLAPLNDLKVPYVEVGNPLLSRKLIQQVRRMPDHLRTDKKLYKTIVRSMSPPNIGFAKYSAIESSRSILRSGQAVGLIKDELSSDYGSCILPRQLIEYILRNLETAREDANQRRTAKHAIRRYTPTWLRNRVLGILKPRMDFNILAFRAYVICKMGKMLAADARMLFQVFAAK
jgi:hypothetical protein